MCFCRAMLGRVGGSRHHVHRKVRVAGMNNIRMQELNRRRLRLKYDLNPKLGVPEKPMGRALSQTSRPAPNFHSEVTHRNWQLGQSHLRMWHDARKLLRSSTTWNDASSGHHRRHQQQRLPSSPSRTPPR